MSINFAQCNMVSTPYMDIPQDKDRRYIAVIAITLTTVTISRGTPFTLDVGAVWSPIPAPINDIAFSGTGTLILG